MLEVLLLISLFALALALGYRVYKYEKRKCKCGSWRKREYVLLYAPTGRRAAQIILDYVRCTNYIFDTCPRCRETEMGLPRPTLVSPTSFAWKVLFNRGSLRHKPELFRAAGQADPLLEQPIRHVGPEKLDHLDERPSVVIVRARPLPSDQSSTSSSQLEPHTA